MPQPLLKADPLTLYHHFTSQSWYKLESGRVIEIVFDKKETRIGFWYKSVHVVRKDENRANDTVTEQERITMIGKKPKVIDRGKRLIHLPGDPREWYPSCYFDMDEATHRAMDAEQLKRWNEMNPFGNTFDLAPLELPNNEDDRYEIFWPESYKRIQVLGLKQITIKDEQWSVVVDTDEVKAKRPYPFPKVEPQYPYMTRVGGSHLQNELWFQYEPRKALCAAYGAGQGVFQIEKAVAEFDRQITNTGGRFWLGNYWTFQDQFDRFASPTRSGPRPYQITIAELISLMHPSTHIDIFKKLAEDATNNGPAKVQALALFENLDMSSSALGQRTVLLVGAGCQIKTIEGLPPFINDLPSTRQYPVLWAPVDTNVRYQKL